MLGREYWDAINGAEMVEVEGETAEEAFEEYVDSLAVWYAGNPIELELERIHLQKRRFVAIDDSPAEIARKLREAAAKDLERPWLLQWATGVEENPADINMRARALINLPDARIIDPDGPLGCVRGEPGRWIVFGFSPLREDPETDNDNVREHTANAPASVDEEIGPDDDDVDPDDLWELWAGLPDPARDLLDLTANPTLREFLRGRCHGPHPSSETLEEFFPVDESGSNIDPQQAAGLICAWCKQCAGEAERLQRYCRHEWLWFSLGKVSEMMNSVRQERLRTEWTASNLPRRCPCCQSPGPQMLVDQYGVAEFRCVCCGLVWPRDMGSESWGENWGQKFLKIALNGNLRPGPMEEEAGQWPIS